MAPIPVIDVALDVRSGGAGAQYTYRWDAPAQVGDAFVVPLGGRSVLGFVVGVRKVAPEALGFPVEHLREAEDRVDGLSLPESLIHLVRFVADEYLCPLPVALGVATPPAARERVVATWTLADFNAETPLTPTQKEIVRTLKEQGGTLVESPTKKLPKPTQRSLKLLRAKGLVHQSLALAPYAETRRGLSLLRLTLDEEKVERFLKREGKKKPAQAITLMRLQTAAQSRLTPAEIKAMSGVTDSTIRSLQQAGLLESIDADAPEMRPAPTPNRYQQLAIDSIVDAMDDARAAKTFLLFGVTGSGKTEVYLRCAAEALRRGKQVLFLVPEIALAVQALSQLRERFGRSVALLHSDLPPRERLENWARVRSGEAPVVLGARSALFAPLSNLGLIVMDEEHEGSYKQETSPRYHAKRLAGFLSRRFGCPLVLGSATPSVESMQQAERGEITLLSLPERAASAKLPSVQLVNLAEGYRKHRPSLLSTELHAHMDATLARQEQIILFLNRRAYAPYLSCRECGYAFRCSRCAVSLAYSRQLRRLRCHHCGFSMAPPDLCPSCQSPKLSPMGVGTEKVEEAVREAFPDAVVARLDRDVARKRGALEETLAQFRSGDVQILVGTQMVAKGLDFPNVTLVGVIAADLSLNIPDFRASERTFQLLSQVAGRAGRGKAPGHVVIQTFNPDHVALVCAQTHAYLPFFEAVRVEREEAHYPPYTRLVNIVVSGPRLDRVKQCADEALELLEGIDGIVLGPADCPIERLVGDWRRHLLVKLAPEADMAALQPLVDYRPKDVRVTIDVDPYSMM